jgi:hypothetical protein
MKPVASLLWPGLEIHDLRQFHNGGQPLFARDDGAWRLEVCLRGAPQPGTETWNPFVVNVFLSSELFLDVRRRYYRPTSKPTERVVSGNLGQWRDEQTYVLFNAPNDSMQVVAADRIEASLQTAFELAEGLVSPSMFGGRGALLGPVASVEWCLIEFGRRAAADLLCDLLHQDRELGDDFYRRLMSDRKVALEGWPEAPAAQNLAAMAAVFRFRLS